ADLAIDQGEVAREAEDIQRRYAERAAQILRQSQDELRGGLGETLARLRDRLERVPRDSLTPYSKEELEVVERRLADLERTLKEGDVAEALGMARQAEAGLENMEAELEAVIADEPRSARRLREAYRAVERAQPVARELAEKLAQAAPSPD